MNGLYLQTTPRARYNLQAIYQTGVDDLQRQEAYLLNRCWERGHQHANTKVISFFASLRYDEVPLTLDRHGEVIR